ncbi:MAG: NAD(P)-binding protein [Lachnospiraceae bacterium]|nr:NAD(P)-binding protein [Lachnospiraceae bacterium]
MIQINQLKVPSTIENADLTTYIADAVRTKKEDIKSYKILKCSVDARKKPNIYYVYSVAVDFGKGERQILKRYQNNANISLYQQVLFQIPASGEKDLNNPPVIVGAGPGGLFCAYVLAMAGYAPLIIERGSSVEQRTKDVEKFWQSNILSSNSNVQFGEGGAGTFSDGKLNTLVKDKTGKNRFVLETFVKFGAPEQILWDAKPHIGTDILVNVIKNMRRVIISLGGRFLFDTCVTDFVFENQRLQGIYAEDTYIKTDICILAIGHSARDTFRKLYERSVPMSAKEFAVGFRVEHPQEMINRSQYGEGNIAHLPVAPYKLATKLANGRGVYSFCMCPGGYVVNASSAPGQLVVNGMSYSKRDSANANSAIVVSVGKDEYALDDPMGAVEFQNQLEKKAYDLCRGKIPQQLFGDFVARKESTGYGAFHSETKGDCGFADLNPLFTDAMRGSFLEGMGLFGKYIQGFDREDAILSGIESRTSSPLRIHRDDGFESSMKGLFPCGEGAGYAGGIMSAAMDGVKIAEEIIKRYKVEYE